LRLRVLGPAKTAAKAAKATKPAKPVTIEETLDDPIPEFDEAAE
jgi:hypothetical protein